MAGDAICRSLLSPVTIDAEAHVDLDRSHRDRHIGDIAVTTRTIDAGADMRRMIELHVGGGSETVDSLPGDIQAGVVISGQLLDLRTIRCQYLVAAHAQLDTGNSRHRTFVDADMTCRAVDPVRYMSAMRKRDRLYGSSAPANEFLNCACHRGVLGCKDLASRQGMIIVGGPRVATRAQNDSRHQCQDYLQHSPSVFRLSPT